MFVSEDSHKPIQAMVSYYMEVMYASALVHCFFPCIGRDVFLLPHVLVLDL